MAEQDQLNDALSFLEKGDYEKAWELYGQLLELFPGDAEYRCGMYAAGYWNNRQDHIRVQKTGRTPGSYLFREWHVFQKLAEEKEFVGCLSFRAIMHHVLGTAADQFRIAFQEEGGRSLDANLLIDLSTCLVKIQDYKNAIEILQYARRVHTRNAAVLFLLGESLCCTDHPGGLEQGLSFYRDSFLIDPARVDPSLISSAPLVGVFEKLHAEKERKLDEVMEWLPAHVLAAFFLPGMRRLPEPKISEIMMETERLTGDLKTVIDKFKDKVRARLAFYCLILMHHHAFPTREQVALEEYEAALRETAPGVYAYYKENL